MLQSSVMAISMYEDMGFRTVAPYVTFAQSSVKLVQPARLDLPLLALARELENESPAWRGSRYYEVGRSAFD